VKDVADTLNKAGGNVDADACEQAARLAKTDFNREMVKEFTQLQSGIGGLYAQVQGGAQKAADAIYDHNRPVSTEDRAPRTIEGAVLSIADKVDTVVGMFGLDQIPSGSKDPFALRRQTNAIIKTIAEHKLPLSLEDLFADSMHTYNRTEL